MGSRRMLSEILSGVDSPLKQSKESDIDFRVY